MKTWEVYKKISEWDENTDPIMFKHLPSNGVYKASYNQQNGNKGLKIIDKKKAKTKYKFHICDHWEGYNNKINENY